MIIVDSEIVKRALKDGEHSVCVIARRRRASLFRTGPGKDPCLSRGPLAPVGCGRSAVSGTDEGTRLI
jgi:hypothetical protein